MILNACVLAIGLASGIVAAAPLKDAQSGTQFYYYGDEIAGDLRLAWGFPSRVAQEIDFVRFESDDDYAFAVIDAHKSELVQLVFEASLGRVLETLWVGRGREGLELRSSTSNLVTVLENDAYALMDSRFGSQSKLSARSRCARPEVLSRFRRGRGGSALSEDQRRRRASQGASRRQFRGLRASAELRHSTRSGVSSARRRS